MAESYTLAHSGEQLDESVNRPIGISGGGTGQTSRFVPVTVTNDTSTVTGHNITVRYFPYLQMAFIRGTVQYDNVAVAAGTWTPICSVPAAYAPTYRTVLAAAMGDTKPLAARVKSDGVIEVASSEPLGASTDYYAYISGWWMVPTT